MILRAPKNRERARGLYTLFQEKGKTHWNEKNVKRKEKKKKNI